MPEGLGAAVVNGGTEDLGTVVVGAVVVAVVVDGTAAGLVTPGDAPGELQAISIRLRINKIASETTSFVFITILPLLFNQEFT